jgi:hypothetical protein
MRRSRDLGTPRGVAWLMAALLGASPTAAARPEAGPPIIADDAVDSGAVAVRVTQTELGIDVEARVQVWAMPAAAWAVLTDYEGIPRIVSSMRTSRVTGRDGNLVTVEQSAVGRVLLVRRRVETMLEVREEPPARIAFEDVLHRDFETYRGTWEIVERGPRVEIVYRVLARPAFSVPGPIARGAFRRTVRDLVADVAIEIERQAAIAGHPEALARRALSN